MTESNLVSVRLACEFLHSAREAKEAGFAFGPSPDGIIVDALLNGRMDWLPPECPHPLDAVQRILSLSPVWWHTLMHVHGLRWRE